VDGDLLVREIKLPKELARFMHEGWGV